MANTPEIHVAEHTTGEGVKAKRTALYGWYAAALSWVRIAVDADGKLVTSGAGGGAATNVDVTGNTVGLATGAKQDTGNTSLASIDGKIPASPSQEHTTAGSPTSTRLTDGSTFYKATTPTDTQPVSAATLPLPTGAATSAKQPALGTAGTASTDVLTVQGIASMTALKVDGSAVTQPVSAASLPLPTGASTAAKQPALGTAGSASADVLTVQGIASMTALKVDGSAVTQPVSGTLTAVPAPSSGSQTFTGTGNGTTVDVSTTSRRCFAVMVKGTGAAATSWTVVLEGSLDNVNFSEICSHTTTDGNAAIVWSGVIPFPVLYFRVRVSALVLGSATNINVFHLGV